MKMVSKLFERREVRLRNETAALEAERRLMALTEGPRDPDAPAWRAYGEEPFSLRPESEAVLRGIFEQVDTNASGRVSGQSLLNAMREASSATELMAQWMGRGKWNRWLEALESSLGPEETITWGEFLLHFIPPPGTRRPRLRGQGQGTIMPDGLMLQLFIPPEWSDTSALAQYSIDSLTPTQLRWEVGRLMRERSYLLGVLGRDARNTLTRAEQVESACMERIAQWRHEAQNLQSRLKRAELSVETAEKARLAAEEALAASERRRRAYGEDGSAAAVSVRGRLESEIQEKDCLNRRLQAEIGALRKEQAKLLIGQQSLQRELARSGERMLSVQAQTTHEMTVLQERVKQAEKETVQLRHERNRALASLKAVETSRVLRCQVQQGVPKCKAEPELVNDKEDVEAGYVLLEQMCGESPRREEVLHEPVLPSCCSHGHRASPRCSRLEELDDLSAMLLAE
jgi:hypothetical protein